jgi:hypothetical protein
MSNTLNQPSVDAGNNLLPPGLPGDLGGGVPASVRKSRVPTQAIVILLILGVSTAALVTMRRIGMKSGMSMAVAELPQNLMINKEDSIKSSNYERIMADLQRVQKPLDVALGEFGKSPFMMASPVSAAQVQAPTLDPAAQAAEKTRREKEARREKLAQAFTTLRLQSVMDGRNPLCRINGDVFRVGDSIGELFFVKSIKGRDVQIGADDDTFLLSMDETEGPQKDRAHSPR